MADRGLIELGHRRKIVCFPAALRAFVERDETWGGMRAEAPLNRMTAFPPTKIAVRRSMSQSAHSPSILMVSLRHNGKFTAGRPNFPVGSEPAYQNSGANGRAII